MSHRYTILSHSCHATVKIIIDYHKFCLCVGTITLVNVRLQKPSSRSLSDSSQCRGDSFFCLGDFFVVALVGTTLVLLLKAV